MSDSIEQLRDELRLTDDPEERYQLLTDLVTTLRVHSDFQSAIEPAREALALAESLDDKSYKVNALRLLAIVQADLNDFKTALANAKRLLKLSQQMNDRAAEADALGMIGRCQMGLGDYPRALESFEAGHEILREVDAPITLAKLLINISVIHAELGNSQLALDELLQALAIVEDRDETNMLPLLLNNIGWTYYHAGEIEDAERYWRQGLEGARATGNSSVESKILGNLSGLYYYNGDPQHAMELLQSALELIRERADESSMATTIGLLGRMHLVRGEYDLAIEHLLKARDAAEARGDMFTQLVEDFLLGQARLESGAPGEAIATLNEALALGVKIGVHVHDWELHRFLSLAYEQLGDLPNAFAHHKRYAETKEEVMGKEQQKAIDNLRTRYEIESAKKEREIYRLKSEKLQMELQHKTNELTSMALHLVQKNEVLEKLKDEVVQMVNAATADARPMLKKLVPMIQQSIGSDEEWSAFEQQFQQVHPEFVDALLGRARDLTQAEIRVASLLRINMSTKDIAALLSVTTRAVEKHRLNMRKKLALDAEVSLPTYLAML